MTDEERNEIIGKASKSVILSKDFNSALELLEGMLDNDPNDIDALSLKGNIIDLYVSQTKNLSEEEKIDKLNESKGYYEKILRINSNFVRAIIDIGDYWEQFDNYQSALEWYYKARDLLKNGIYSYSLEDEINETNRQIAYVENLLKNQNEEDQ